MMRCIRRYVWWVFWGPRAVEVEITSVFAVFCPGIVFSCSRVSPDVESESWTRGMASKN
jgi:hypothetical protein